MLSTQSMYKLVALGSLAILPACDQRSPVEPAKISAPSIGPSLFYDENLPPGDSEPTDFALTVGVSGPLSVSGSLPMPYPAQYTSSVSGARTSEIEYLWFTSVCNLDTSGDCSETLWADTPDARGVG